jgi:hypothetical protein
MHGNNIGFVYRVFESDNFVWSPMLLMWVPMTQPTGGGGGGGPVTIADGADVAEGATTDAAVQGDNPGTVSAKLRGLNKSIAAGVPVTNAGLTNLDVALSTRLKPADTLAKVSVVDTITNPVAVTNANLDVALSTRLADATFTTRINTQGQKTMATSTPVVLASDQAAIPVTVPNPLPISAAALPLPANAAIESGGHLAALDVTLDAAQGAPSSGQAGPMVQEIIEQDPTPHLFAGVLSPLSVDQDRNLRIALAKPNIEGSIERLIAELRAQRFEDYLRSGVGL